MGAPDFPRRPLTDNFLYRTLVRVNAYKCAKFRVPNSISYRDMEGIPEYKVGAADLPRRPLAVKFLPVAIAPANACQCTKFQLSSSISFGDMREQISFPIELSKCGIVYLTVSVLRVCLLLSALSALLISLDF